MKYLLFIISLISSLCVCAQSYTSYFTGDSSDVQVEASYGVCLMGGGTEDDRAMQWFLQKANGGDVLVIRTSGSNGYNDYLYSELGIDVNSVETIVFNNASASNDDYVLEQIANAEAIWIAGGDQSVYMDYWKDNAVEDLLNNHINIKQGVIGGTSAGMAVLGGSYFSAENGTVYSAEALEDPYNPFMTLGYNDFITITWLNNTITDTHFSERNREGRLLTFLAKMHDNLGNRSFGIACDEYTAVCIDHNGLARVFGEWPDYDDYAFFVQMNCESTNSPEMMQSGIPLTWNFNGEAAKVYKVGGTVDGSHYLELNNWQTGEGGEWQHWYADNGLFYEEAGTGPNCDDLDLASYGDTTVNTNLIKRIDLLGREVPEKYNGITIEEYENGSTKMRFSIK